MKDRATLELPINLEAYMLSYASAKFGCTALHFKFFVQRVRVRMSGILNYDYQTGDLLHVSFCVTFHTLFHCSIDHLQYLYLN